MLTTTAINYQRAILQNISWQTFDTILAEIGDNRATRLAYDRGNSPVYRQKSANWGNPDDSFISCLAKTADKKLTDSYQKDVPYSASYSASYAKRCFMPSVEADEKREHRIQTEILVDAEDKEDRAMGWYYYLEECLNFPFMAKWAKKSRKSGSVEEKQVEVLGMAPDDECLKDMIVEVAYILGKDDDVFSAKLSEIVAIDADSETEEAIADWHYWIARGYKF